MSLHSPVGSGMHVRISGGVDNAQNLYQRGLPTCDRPGLPVSHWGIASTRFLLSFQSSH